jgi:hypothetical protein
MTRDMTQVRRSSVLAAATVTADSLFVSCRPPTILACFELVPLPFFSLLMEAGTRRRMRICTD